MYFLNPKDDPQQLNQESRKIVGAGDTKSPAPIALCKKNDTHSQMSVVESVLSAIKVCKSRVNRYPHHTKTQ